MKLKKAKKIASRLGYNYIAADKADADGEMDLYGFLSKPTMDEGEWTSPYSVQCNAYIYLGVYTGSKDWKDTLREVR